MCLDMIVNDLTDEERIELGQEDEVLDEIAEEFYDDPDGALERLDELGFDFDDMPL